MSTTPVAETAKTPKVKTAPKSIGTTLHGQAGDTIRFIAVRRGNGAVSYSIHTEKNADGTKVNTRGASADHASFDEASARVEKLAAAAMKDGWSRKVRAVGGRKADAFTADALPKPKSAPAGSAPAAPAKSKK